MIEVFVKDLIVVHDGASLTCLGNDYGYEHVFSKQIELHGTKNDILVAISSSGNSKNIINAVNMGIKKKMFVITLSGFKENNKLKNLGDFSFFVSNEKYGYVEILHLIILHSFLDILANSEFFYVSVNLFQKYLLYKLCL